MTTFFTALLWGLGASLGATVGLLVFAGAFGFFLRDKEGAELSKQNLTDSLAALLRRNELGEQQVAALRRIAETMEEANS